MSLLNSIEIIRFFQQFSSPGLDRFFEFISWLGTATFYLAVLPVVFWSGNRKTGFRLMMLFFLGVFINLWLKDVFHTPRPSSDLVRVLAHETTFAFPSGHTQGAALFWAYLADEWRGRGILFIAIPMIILVAISRLYLGAHFLGDVLGGAAIGIVLALVGRRVAIWIGKAVDLDSILLKGVLILAPFALMLLYSGPGIPEMVGGMVGLTLGYLMNNGQGLQRMGAVDEIVKSFAGLGILVAIRLLLGHFLPSQPNWLVVEGFVQGLWITALAPGLFKWIYGSYGW